MVGGEAVLVRTSLFAPDGASSAILKLIMSTMLDTSFLILSGSDDGSIFPVNFKLHRYMARANSGKYSCPARVVSAKVLFIFFSILDKVYQISLAWKHTKCAKENHHPA